MSSIVVSGAKLRAQSQNYLTDVAAISKKLCDSLPLSTAFEDIYKLALSAEVVLNALQHDDLRPTLTPHRGIAVRVPLFVSIGQSSVAKLELRRFIELTLWTVYFTHHPIEWQHFERKRGAGYTRDQGQPIGYAAHRDLRFYQDYARELMQEEPSGLGLKAVAGIDQARNVLNGAVHAGELARMGAEHFPHETPNETTLRKFATIERNTFCHCVLLLAAFDRKQFDQLPAQPKAYFNWLVGSDLRKEVQKGQFGLAW